MTRLINIWRKLCAMRYESGILECLSDKFADAGMTASGHVPTFSAL